MTAASARPRGRPAAAAAILLLLLVAGAAALRSRLSSRPPNVVLVVWDTCRADRLSACGYARPTTPRLEAFARGAVTFRNAFAPAPWTPPSHASLFTGLLPSRHGLTQGSGQAARVRRGIPLLAETLAAAGYETVGFSANPCLSPVTGLDAGFRRMVPLYEGTEGKGSGARALRSLGEWLDGRRTSPDGDRPAFVFVNLMETHLPRSPADDALGAVRDPAVPDADLPAARALTEREALLHQLRVAPLGEGTIRAASTLYDGACREVDGITGSLLDRLGAAGLLEGAVVAIASDHGEALGEHGEMGHRMSVRDTLLRVPLVVRWPGRLDGGRAEEAQVRLQDLYPTILEAAGVPVPAGNGIDAESLAVPRLRGRPARAEFERADLPLDAVRAMLGDAPATALDAFRLSFVAARDPAETPGARKYVRVLRLGDDGRTTTEREELFDPAADPGEERNLLVPGAPAEERAAAERLRR